MSFLIFISFFLSLFILSGILIVDSIDFEKSFKLSILTITNTTTSAMFGIENMEFTNLLTTYPASSGPDMLLLLLKAPTNNLAPSSPTRLTS